MTDPRTPGDVLERAIAAIGEAPRAPSFQRLEARIAAREGDARALDRPARGRWVVRGAMVAAAACVVAAVFATRPAADASGWRLEALSRDGGAGRPVRVLREGSVGQDRKEVALDRLRPGDVIESPDATRLRIGERLVVELERESRVALVEGDRLLVRAGRATFDLGPGSSAAPTRFGSERVAVVDRGTRFALDVADDAGVERLLVTVESGRVAANDVPLAAGEGLAFRDGVAVGAPWPLDAKPSVTLEAEDGAPRAGTPVTLRFVLSNPTDGWIPLPIADGLKAPLMLEVTDPAGTATSVRVTGAMFLPRTAPASGSGTAIPPRGRLTLRVRFEHTFASPGTYRLRAVYRPAGAVESPTSPGIVLDVR